MMCLPLIMVFIRATLVIDVQSLCVFMFLVDA